MYRPILAVSTLRRWGAIRRDLSGVETKRCGHASGPGIVGPKTRGPLAVLRWQPGPVVRSAGNRRGRAMTNALARNNDSSGLAIRINDLA